MHLQRRILFFPCVCLGLTGRGAAGQECEAENWRSAQRTLLVTSSLFRIHWAFRCATASSADGLARSRDGSVSHVPDARSVLL